MLKIVDTSIPAAAPAVTLAAPENGTVAEAVAFSAAADSGLSYLWKFGDGTTGAGAKANHTYTHAGDFTVELAVEGVDGLTARKTAHIRITGEIKTPFPLSNSRPYIEK
jgi:PKD repeat protein